MAKDIYKNLSENREFAMKQWVGFKYAILSSSCNSLSTNRLQNSYFSPCFAPSSLRRKGTFFTA